jgi:Domain of unknown function DUF302
VSRSGTRCQAPAHGLLVLHPLAPLREWSAEAEAFGLELRDTKVVIFGSPLAGTPVMSAAPLAALDLPLKVLVWADGDQTKLSCDGPAGAGRTVRA